MDWEVEEQLGGSRVEARLGKVTEELGPLGLILSASLSA